MNKNSLVKTLLLFSAFILLTSCDKDFNTIGSDIVGQNYFDLDKGNYDVVVSNEATGPVQSNNLAINSLGIYKNDKFGTASSHFVTQLAMSSYNPTIPADATVDSVWVYVPYTSKVTGQNSNGGQTYELTSVTGGTSKFQIKVYESGYYLSNYDPTNTLDGVQRHYSDEKSKVENNLIGSNANGDFVPNGEYLNNSTDHSENTEFFFDPSERLIYKTNGSGSYVNSSGTVLADQTDTSKYVVKERFAPGMWLNLNKKFFENKILKAPTGKLTNDNIFKEYFRGLYFQVEEQTPGQGGALALLDFTKGYIKINYKSGTTRTSISLALKGNTINFFDNGYTAPTVTPGNDSFFLKGGNGVMANIDVFGPDSPNQTLITEIKNNKWLINEANLVFYLDEDNMGTSVVPQRIYLYDVKNKKPIADYYADGSTNGSDPKKNKSGFGGIYEEDAQGRKKYKIRITEYLKAFVNKDSTNYKLGLVVTENINESRTAFLKPLPSTNPTKTVPVANVYNPFGVILHGPNSSNSEKRLKLEIYYTKPD